MTREFAKQQLARIQAWWPSLPATSQAVDEFVRALGGFTEAEIDGAVSDVIDTHPESASPKLTHLKAACRARRPKTFSTATEEERDTIFSWERQQRLQQEQHELDALASRIAADPQWQARYDALMAQTLEHAAVGDGEFRETARKVFRATVLRLVEREMAPEPLRVVR